jgi:hypothetical protein
MISPSAREELQKKINDVLERAKGDPVLQAQVDEALADAQCKNDEAIASRRASGGLVSEQYQALLNRGLV